MLFQKFVLSTFLMWSCNARNFKVVADIPKDLKEVSAAEITSSSDLLWVIEDAGNKNELIGLNLDGSIQKKLKVSNAKNEDWEELTSDTAGNLYIGDFGNNSGKRDHFSIYQVAHPETANSDVTATRIDFHLPQDMKSKDFESFFIYNNFFYIFSKETKKCILIKVPNSAGDHLAEIITVFNLEGKNNRVTSADISTDGKIVVLLNHDKVWKLTDFKSDDFFSGTAQEIPLGQNSQKEGICFKTDSLLYITDERRGNDPNHIYSLKL